VEPVAPLGRLAEPDDQERARLDEAGEAVGVADGAGVGVGQQHIEPEDPPVPRDRAVGVAHRQNGPRSRQVRSSTSRRGLGLDEAELAAGAANRVPDPLTAGEKVSVGEVEHDIGLAPAVERAWIASPGRP